MVRIRYLLKSMLIWLFILGWWTGLVVWVVATGAWPRGVLGGIVWFFCMMFWAMPTIMAYWSWEYWRDQEKQRRFRAWWEPKSNSKSRREGLT
jgi:hypothetical protein